jgi:hypothetical protein
MCNAKNHPAGCNCGWGPNEPEVAGGTKDITTLPTWKKNELEAFDKEILNAEKTIAALNKRISTAEKEGRALNQEDMKWLNKNQFGGPTGYRAKHYKTSLPCIKAVIDDYESKFNSANWRDALTLILESLKFKGVTWMNRVMYDVEIGRTTEYREKLMFQKARGQKH